MFQTKNKDELKRINHQLSRVEASAHQLRELEEELKRAVRKSNEFLKLFINQAFKPNNLLPAVRNSNE